MAKIMYESSFHRTLWRLESRRIQIERRCCCSAVARQAETAAINIERSETKNEEEEDEATVELYVPCGTRSVLYMIIHLLHSRSCRDLLLLLWFGCTMTH